MTTEAVQSVIPHEIYEENETVSPINLTISTMTVITLQPLQWYYYEKMPKKSKITNTAKTVAVSAKWPKNRPYLTSGPLISDYVLYQIHFHWGPNEMQGSEHFVDGASQPMELHAVHIKSDYHSQEVALRAHDGVTIVVYMFKLQSQPNPAFNAIVRSLDSIHQPYTSTRIIVEPMINILQPFTNDYFAYRGYIQESNIRHRVLWLISRESIGISLEQIAEFRTLNDKNLQPILNNCRPLQSDENARVFHICPSGITHASLKTNTTSL